MAWGEAHFRLSPTETALDRMAASLERLVKVQTDAQAPPEASEVILQWLSRLDHGELDHVVMTRQKLGQPVMWIVLEVLKEWASDSGA